MFIHYRTEGIILNKKEKGEADQIFTIYTKGFGMLFFLAKAARKIKSKLRGGLRLFSLSKIEFIQGKTYKTLTDALSIERFSLIEKDLIRLRIAYRISEVLTNLIKEEVKDRRIWNFLVQVFEKLDNHNFSADLVYYYFFWNFMDLAGYQPSIYHCSICQKKLVPDHFYFSSEQGGIICSQCSKRTKSRTKSGTGIRVDLDLIKILRIILKKDWPQLEKIKIETSHLKSLKKISENYYLFLSSQ